LYNSDEIAVIPWYRFNDFIEGKQNNFDFLCKFMKTKNDARSFAPNTKEGRFLFLKGFGVIHVKFMVGGWCDILVIHRQ
jgi:hypothetical protein